MNQFENGSVSPKHFSSSAFVRWNLLILLSTAWIYFGRRAASTKHRWNDIIFSKWSKFQRICSVHWTLNTKIAIWILNQCISSRYVVHFQRFHFIFLLLSTVVFNLSLQFCSFDLLNIGWMIFSWTNRYMLKKSTKAIE